MPKGRTSFAVQLHALLDALETDAAAVRRTLALLNGHAEHKSQRRAPSILQQALAIDQTRRRQATPPPAPTKARWGEKRKLRREETARLLANFNPDEPQQLPGTRMSVLIQHGYLKKKGSGYVRTSKPFTV